MHFEVWQWLLGAVAASIIGLSKTGIPGLGVIVVSILAYAFGGWSSVGIMLPMMIFADCFAVFWYHNHAQWDKLAKLFPWVAAGMVIGGINLWIVGKDNGHKEIIDVLIAVIILAMLALHFLNKRFGDRLSPKSRIGTASTGTVAGYVTTISNAAGPIMQLYMMAHKMKKEQFMGTIAWYFLIINVSKLPVYIVLTHLHPKSPMITSQSLLLNLALVPFILLGVFSGKWLLHRVSQKFFEAAVLLFAGVISLKLLLAYFGIKF